MTPPLVTPSILNMSQVIKVTLPLQIRKLHLNTHQFPKSTREHHQSAKPILTKTSKILNHFGFSLLWPITLRWLSCRPVPQLPAREATCHERPRRPQPAEVLQINSEALSRDWRKSQAIKPANRTCDASFDSVSAAVHGSVTQGT